METDMLVIGGGPAGLCAAYEAAYAGHKVTIVDESFRMGGQLKQQTQVLDLPYFMTDQSGKDLCVELIERLKTYDVTFLPQHIMVGAYENGNIGVTDGHKTHSIRFKRAIMATGASENPIPFKGWTLPGVMTIGGAQILLNREGALEEGNVVIIGINELSVGIIDQFKQKGVDVSAIIDGSLGSEACSQKVKDELANMDIPIYNNVTSIQAKGSGEVKQVLIEYQGSEVSFEVDLACVSGGLSPILEPFQVLGCELAYQESLGGWVPKYTETFQTSVPNIYVAGNAAGITSMKAIILMGHIAGINAVNNLDRKTVNVKRITKLTHALFESESGMKVEEGRKKLFNAYKMQTAREQSIKKGAL
ncbi:MAG TPA: FAD-dependent oxidoreductase [Bacillota bacterium]|nr:FAD-dependent oxidoreductase [Bacillota bacterium]